jgi:hypothetical protein
MQLDDLRSGHVCRRLRGEAHHEDGSDGEVGSCEHVGRRSTQALELGRIKAGRPDHHMHTGGHGLMGIGHRRGGNREVHEHVGTLL